MKLLLLLIMVIPIIYFASRHRKWYLYLTFAFFGLLPDTFAIEVSSRLPLITVERLMVLFLLMVWLYETQGTTEMGKYLRPITIYLFVNIAISIIDLRYGFGEINKLFILLFEQLCFVVVITSLIADWDEINRCFDYMIAGSVVQCFIGILQTVTGYDLSTALNLVERRAESGLTLRMGLERASGTIGAIQLGSYCAILFIMSMYRYDSTRKSRYILAMVIEVIAMCCSMSRSSIGPFVLILVLMFFQNIRKFLHLYGKYIVLAVIAVIVVLMASSGIRNVAVGVIGSMISTLGGHVAVSEDFGMNVNGFASRFLQFSAIPYMFRHGGALFGLGYNAYVRGMLYYFFPQWNAWTVAPALDVGIVGIFGESGLAGLVNWGIFVITILIKTRRYKRDIFYKYFFYIICLYIMLNIFTAFASNGTIWLLWSAFITYDKFRIKEKNNDRLLTTVH